MFTATSQHALRALAHLSQVPAGDFILGRQLAEVAEVPANFLSKIMLTFRKAGLVEATRGHGGGYRLVKQARDITLLQVVELFEGTSAQPRCVLGERHHCNNEQGCVAHTGWQAVSDAYLEFLRSNTIADIGLHQASEQSPQKCHSSPGG